MTDPEVLALFEASSDTDRAQLAHTLYERLFERIYADRSKVSSKKSSAPQPQTQLL